jgi:hypothetical protein
VFSAQFCCDSKTALFLNKSKINNNLGFPPSTEAVPWGQNGLLTNGAGINGFPHAKREFEIGFYFFQ